MQLKGEIIADGGKSGRGLGRANFPLPLEILYGYLAARLLDLDEADIGVICGEDFEVAVQGIVEREFHVRLAGAEPDFADEKVVDGEMVFAFDLELYGRAGMKGTERDAPIAFGVGLGFLRLAGERDRDVFTGIGEAPDGHGHLALEHGVLGEDGWKLDVGAGGGQ